MPMDLAGKVALITGGGQGLGKAFAEALLRRGGKVSLADINEEVGAKTAAEFNKAFGPGSAFFVLCDVTSESKFEGAFIKTQEIFKKIDILINNAGIADESVWSTMININFNGVVHGSMLALKYMGRDAGGDEAVVVNIASTAGLTPVWFEPVYAGTKHAVVGYTRSLAESIQYIPGVSMRVLCLCPSFTKTAILDVAVDDELKQQMLQGVGVMEPEDVSRAFIRLLDDVDNNGGVMHITPKGMKYKYPYKLLAKGKL